MMEGTVKMLIRAVLAIFAIATAFLVSAAILVHYSDNLQAMLLYLLLWG